MVCFLEGLFGEKPDFRMALASMKPEPPICEEEEYRTLFEMINLACNETEDPENIRLYLKRGIEFTGMSAEVLSQRTLDLGFPELAEYYRDYHE